MARGRQPNTNREINWVTDEDGNVLGYMKDAKTLIPITELSEAQLANPLIKGAAGVGNGRIYDENAQEIGPTAQLAVVNIGQGSTTVLDSSVNNKRFVCAGMPEVTINAGVSGFNVAHFSGDFWFTGTAAVTDTRTLGVSPEATLRKVSGDSYVLTGTKGYVQQDIGCKYTGVNLSGMEFGVTLVPSKRSVDFWYGRGANIIRLPVIWERLQPTALGSLDSAELSRVQSVLAACESRGITLLIDIHNYGDYLGSPSAFTAANFADLFSRLSAAIGPSANVVWGLMNEPNGAAGDYKTLGAKCVAAIAAIRANGCNQPVLVPIPSGSNGLAFVDMVAGRYGFMMPSRFADKNIWFEVHQYGDIDLSGTVAGVRGPDILRKILAPVTGLARQLGVKLFYGEFGSDNVNAASLQATARVCNFVNQNSDVWIGFTAWGAGEYWNSNYVNLLQGPNCTDTAQSLNLRPYFSGGAKRKVNAELITTPCVMGSTSATFVDAGDGNLWLTGGSVWTRGGTVDESFWWPTWLSGPNTIDMLVQVPSSYAGGSYKFLFGSGNLCVGLSSTGVPLVSVGNSNAVASATIADSSQHHVRACYSRTLGARLYVDGVLVASFTTKGDAITGAGGGSFAWGARWDNNSNSATASGAFIRWGAIYCGDLSQANFVPVFDPPKSGAQDLYAAFIFDSATNNYA